ncbi:MAG: tautomerase family protein [Chloroflexi bacterium]|nr:tautomerase family protein [Chloroflexota bacterium]
MPVVNIKIKAGRSTETKRQLAREMTQTIMAVLDVPADAVTISIDEYPLEHLAKAGVLFADGGGTPKK